MALPAQPGPVPVRLVPAPIRSRFLFGIGALWFAGCVALGLTSSTQDLVIGTVVGAVFASLFIGLGVVIARQWLTYEAGVLTWRGLRRHTPVRVDRVVGARLIRRRGGYWLALVQPDWGAVMGWRSGAWGPLSKANFVDAERLRLAEISMTMFGPTQLAALVAPTLLDGRPMVMDDTTRTLLERWSIGSTERRPEVE